MRNAVRVQSGQAVVELAIVGSILMLVTFAIIDIGMAVWEYNTVGYLAREGARYGVVPSRTGQQIEDYVFSRAVLPNFSRAACAGRSPGCVEVTSRGTGGCPSSPVVVAVRYPYSAATGLIGGLVGGTINLQASASMYVEPGVGAGGCP
jgi:Flp pilus assembly protein TadG